MSNYSLDAAEIDRRFNYHAIPQDSDTASQMASIRTDIKRLAVELSTKLPTCRETSLAFTKLDEVMFHAISALARDGK